MYHKGIDHPDNEPRRNQFCDPKRKTSFTEEVAETVVDGDLYFSMRCPASMRFYMPVEAGEHGMEEAGLLCVTHKFEKPFPDLKGRWKPYDGGGNLVIKVDDSARGDITYTALRAIEQALYATPLGRAVGRDTLRGMAVSLCKTFGIDVDGDAAPTFTVDPDAEKLVKDALRDLLTYVPEGGYDDRLGKIGADADGVGFAKNAKKYTEVINGISDGFDKPYEKSQEPLPFLSQPVFYAVLGYKGNGRSFQARIDTLKQAIGMDEEEI
jgi:hypothetical protein